MNKIIKVLLGAITGGVVIIGGLHLLKFIILNSETATNIVLCVIAISAITGCGIVINNDIASWWKKRKKKDFNKFD